jgi:beta-lactamase class A
VEARLALKSCCFLWPAAGLAALTVASCGHDHPGHAMLASAITPPTPAPQMAMPVPPPPSHPLAAPAGLTGTIRSLAATFDGKVGIAVRSIDQGWATDANGNTRMPQQSVSKLWVAMTVLDFRDAGRLSLDDRVTVTRDDFTLFHQPIAALVKGDGYHTTVGELLQRALTMSDNTANDKLLRYVGGPEAIRAFIARKGLGNIRFGPGEKLLQSYTAGMTWRPQYQVPGAFEAARARIPASTRVAAFNRYVADPIDGAAPAAIAGALAKLKRGELLSPSSTDYLIGTMESSHTGRQRMRGAVPPGWSFGHKTGTGQDLLGRTAGYNDVGLLFAPDGRAYALAVMIGDTPKPIPVRQELMQHVVEAVVASHDAEPRYAAGGAYR